MGCVPKGINIHRKPPKGFIIRHRWQQTGNSVEGVRNAHSTSSPRDQSKFQKQRSPALLWPCACRPLSVGGIGTRSKLLLESELPAQVQTERLREGCKDGYH